MTIAIDSEILAADFIGTRYKMYSPADMSLQYVSSGVPAILETDIQVAATGILYLLYPIHLPQGSVIKKICGWFYRSTAYGGQFIKLFRCINYRTWEFDILSEKSASSESGDYTLEDNNLNEQIDNTSYIYFLQIQITRVNLGILVKFKGARIEFEVDTPKP